MEKMFKATRAEIEQSLINFITSKIEKRGDTNVVISDIRIKILEYGEIFAFANVAYTWKLNAWEKRASHKDWVFRYSDCEWSTPHLW